MFFCPKCAAQNTEGARFCRACGADVQLVPAAMSGRLPERPADADAPARRSHRRRKGQEPTFEDGVRAIIAGVGFIFVSLGIGLFAPAGRIWFFWLLIPAFFFISDGVSQLLGAKRRQRELEAVARPPEISPPPARPAPLFEPAPRQTGELLPPASVTEGTTRHLDARERPLRDELGGERSPES